MYQPVFKNLNFRMTKRDFDRAAKLEGNAGPSHKELVLVYNLV